MTDPRFEPLPHLRRFPADEMSARARAFLTMMGQRRSVREFSEESVPQDVVENALLVAGTAPSGANMQPWHFALIGDPAVKRCIRETAEIEEREFYERRASTEWLQALEPFGADSSKPFLESAPLLIAIFGQRSGEGGEGRKIRHYYVPESVGIATGFLIAALHNAGLATLRAAHAFEGSGCQPGALRLSASSCAASA